MVSVAISCNPDPLDLKQGTAYQYTLVRVFSDSEVSSEVEGSLNILTAVAVSSSSVTSDQIIYSLPTTFTLTMNKAIGSADISLANVDDDQLTKVYTSSKINGSTIELSVASNLKRASKYRLTLSTAAGQDGSFLDSGYIVNFQTSGGPKVTDINIGSAGIDPNALVIITFDQSISQTQDLSGLVSFAGGNATIGRTDNQITLRLHGLASCSPFSITINSGLASKYDVRSTQSWSYSSRTSCRSSSVIGYSVQGRPIIAYYYGSGPTTVLFTGGIHGNEYSGEYIMQDWVSYLDSYAYKIPADRRVVVVPNVNPDGFAHGSRYNANNVNLDRNFASADWQANIDTGSGTIINGGGTAPMSEPETQALAALTTSLQPRLEVSFHAQGSLLGANQYGDSVDIANIYAASVGYTSMIGHAEEVMGYSITGEYEQWAGEQYGTPAILIELPTSSGRYFSSNQSTLWRMVGI